MGPDLAVYAARPDNSRGRVHADDNVVYRDQYQRDRDRIIHSAAFRRLEYKTQVFVNHEGDMFRTRLTHSIEVAQIGRTIARALRVNEDLTEAICLAHDLGHTPFGHAGQEALNACMRGHGGFEHNLQSLRIVDLLERRYAAFPGLNLMFETREGILKHCSQKEAAALGEIGQRFIKRQKPGLEAQIANIADEIAYNNHDIDDGLRAGLLTLAGLRDCELFRLHHDRVKRQWPALGVSRLRHEIIRRMINALVSDLIETSRALINQTAPATIEDIRTCGRSLIRMSAATDKKHKALKKYLRGHLYEHDRVKSMAARAKATVRALFRAYTGRPALLKQKFRDSIKTGDSNKARIIADYIAGMTDRFAFAELDRIKAEGLS